MMIFLTLFSLLFAGFVIWRGIWFLPLRRTGKFLLSLFLVPVAAKFHLVRWIGGNFFCPSLNRWFLLTLAFLYAAMLIFSFLLLAEELLSLFWSGAKRLFPRLPHFRGNPLRALLALAALVLTAFGLVEGSAMPQVCYEKLPFPDGFFGEKPLRIVLLADLHADEVTRADRIAGIVRRCNELSPDLVVIAGDFADGTVAVAGKELLPLRELKATYGVVGVPGNHEFFSGDPRWPGFFTSLGIRMLVNQAEILPCGIAVAGISDEAAKHASARMPDPDLALAGIPADVPVIFLAHRPHWAKEVAKRGVFLQLSGHTHGGMFFPLSRLVARGNGGFVSGRYKINGLTLIVSNGSGIWSGFPLRLGTPPQIVCVEIGRD